VGSGPYAWPNGAGGPHAFVANDAYHGGAPKIRELKVLFSREASKADEFVRTPYPTVWEWVSRRDAPTHRQCPTRIDP